MAVQFTVRDDLQNKCAVDNNNIPGRYLLEDAIIEYGGVAHGITTYLREIYIFEDIDKPGITGWVELTDLDNLVSGWIRDSSPAGGPHTIVGQELLYMKFKTFASDLYVDFMDHPLHIHKIENLRTYDPGSGATSIAAQQYRLHFCAPELLNNERVRVSQAYEDTYSEIVKDILKTHLKTAKDVWLEHTKDIVKVVIPNMHPFDAIRAISVYAKDKRESMPNYNFYETTKGYRFKTMHSQARKLGGRGSSGGDDTQMVYDIPAGAVDGNYLKQMSNTVNYKYLRIGDTYQDIRTGMFASKSIRHDSYYKVVHHGSARYTHDLPTIWPGYSRGNLHIEPGNVYVPTGESFLPQVPLHNIPKWHESKGFDEFPDSRIFFTSTSGPERFDKVSTTGNVQHGFASNDASDQLTRNLHTMQQRHDRYTSIELEVYGLSGLQVGDGISLWTPVLGADNSKIEDQRWRQPYYITKLVHKVNLRKDQASYKQTLVVNATGSGTQLPSNAMHSGGDGKTGVVDHFRGKLER